MPTCTSACDRTFRLSPTLQTGKLRHRISIVANAPAQDSTGGFNLNTTTLYAQVWAAVEAMTGMEQFATESQLSRVTYQVVILPKWSQRAHVGNRPVRLHG